MINHNDKLEIFERFEVDKNLPKYKEGVQVELGPSQVSGIVTQFGSGSFGEITVNDASSFGTTFVWNSATSTTGLIGGNTIMVPYEKETFISKLYKKWKAKWGQKIAVKEEIKKERKKVHTIIEFFSSLATNLNELKTLTDIAVHYETAITNAQKAGQTALVEQLKSRLNSAKSEAQLVAYNLNLYLTEEQVVEFYKKADRDRKLKLTWMKNFIKPIPTRILEVKEKLDMTFVFDNYVILHYDPNNDATNLTEEEKETLKKDPIIFGLIENSRRLYYVGDWIDDYCNLTLDVVLETLNEKAHEINNNNVKTFIDRGYEVKKLAEVVSEKANKKVTRSKRK